MLTGEAAAERAVAKMQAKPLPNPFAPLQQMQQQQQQGATSSPARSQGVFASMNSAKPGPPPFSIPPAPPPSLYVKALPLTAQSNTLIPSQENKVLELFFPCPERARRCYCCDASHNLLSDRVCMQSVARALARPKYRLRLQPLPRQQHGQQESRIVNLLCMPQP